MDHLHEAKSAQARLLEQSQKRRSRNLILAGLVVAGLLFIVILNFVSLYAASSQTVTNATTERGGTGETLPANMAPGFTLQYQVEGPPELAIVVRDTLPDTLAGTIVGEVTAVSDLNATNTPRLLVELAVVERLWTPVYGRAQVTANIYFANVADVPWPLDEPMILTESPEIQAKGEVTVNDTTWGLLSKPAYTQLLGRALADEIGAKLQDEVFQIP